MNLRKLFIEKELRQKLDKVGGDIFLDNIRASLEMLVPDAIESLMPQIKDFVLDGINNELDKISARVKDGEKGDKGDKGEPGDKGDKGEPGIKGRDGNDGLPGKDGKDGKDGLQGKPGEKGEPGERGIDGKDGPPDSPEQIADKVNTLEDRIELKVLKGFWDVIDKLQRNIKEKQGGGGGGMGNWVTEQPTGAINGSNMAFTLSNNVSGNNRAIVLLYQGQVQEYGTHFSISGKNLTLTFAPETGTTLFAMYVRR